MMEDRKIHIIMIATLIFGMCIGAILVKLSVCQDTDSKTILLENTEAIEEELEIVKEELSICYQQLRDCEL